MFLAGVLSRQPHPCTKRYQKRYHSAPTNEGSVQMPVFPLLFPFHLFLPLTRSHRGLPQGTPQALPALSHHPGADGGGSPRTVPTSFSPFLIIFRPNAPFSPSGTARRRAGPLTPLTPWASGAFPAPFLSHPRPLSTSPPPSRGFPRPLTEPPGRPGPGPRRTAHEREAAEGPVRSREPPPEEAAADRRRRRPQRLPEPGGKRPAEPPPW